MTSSTAPPSGSGSLAIGPAGRRQRPHALKLALAVTAALVLGYLLAGRSETLLRVEAQTLDLRFRMRASEQRPSDVVLVLIDDRSIAEIGRWPWSRREIARLPERLKEAGARVIAFDLLFSEPETPASGLELFSELRAALGPLVSGSSQFGDVLDRIVASSDPDRRLAAALRGQPVVLSFAFGFDAAPAAADRALMPDWLAASAYRAFSYSAGRAGQLAVAATRINPPVPGVGEAAAALAHVNVVLDRDGRARFDLPVVEYGGSYWPSFPMQVARLWFGLTPEQVRVEFGRGVLLGDRLVPTDESMRLMVNHQRSERFQRVSFADVVAGRVPPETFAGKVVLVGGAATGIGDFFSTPFSPLTLGVERYASVVQNVLDQDYLLRRDAFALGEMAALLVGGLLLGWVAAHRGIATLGVTAAVMIALWGGFAWYAFAVQGLWVQAAYPMVGLLVVFSALALQQYLFGQRQARVIRGAFEHYLHPEMVEILCRDPHLLQLGGEEKELTILFADVRNFGAVADRLPAPELVGLMNEFFTAMTDEILAEKGMLDKYIGDGLMAVFNAPLPQSDHALRACRAAIAMQRALRRLHPGWAERGLPALGIRIGVNSGRAVIGNLGAAYRLDYTALGDAVNLASRFETANNTFGTSILIGEDTWHQVKDHLQTRAVDKVTVKGKEQPVNVYELIVE